VYKTKSLGVFFASIVGLGLTLTLLWSLGGIQVVYAADITVDTTDDELNSDGDCSLREAIRAANIDAAVDGCGPGAGADTIQFNLTTPAVITLTQGQLTIRRDPLTIEGPGVNSLAISGDNTARIFDVTNNVAVTLSGMTVRDGNATSPGGGLRTVGTLALIDTAFINNSSASSGGAVEVQRDLTMRDTDVLSNTADGQGGGINTNGSGSLIHITGGHFENNRSGSMAGALYANQTLVISGTHFISNTAQTFGGGVLAWRDAVVTNARFERNTAQNNDIGALYVATDLLMSESTFISNTAGVHYGAVWAGVDVHITGGAFTGNVAQTGHTGALGVDGALWLTGTHFVGNRAATTSGAIDVQGDLRMSGSDVLSNTAGEQGGGVNGYGALTHITGGRFENNRAGSMAGGLYISRALILSGTQFISNSARVQGGAVGAGGDVYVTAGEFISNMAETGRAGALQVGGSLWLTHSHFIANRAATSGGALAHIGSDGRFVNTLFARNHTDGDGGAMVLAHTGAVELVHATIVAPAQPVSAAIFVDASGGVTIVNTTLADYTFGLDVAAGTVYEDYNLFYQSTPVSGTVLRGGHSLSGDPVFADPSKDNYHLLAGSWALNTGTNAGITIDIDGETRPGGGGVDIGFDETTHVSDAVITKMVSTDPVPVPGSPITYTLTFSNAGNTMLPGVIITDIIPTSVHQTKVISSGVVVTDTGANPAYVWQVQGLAPGEGGVITVSGVLIDALARGTFTNTVDIDSMASELNVANNVAAASVTAPNVAPIAVNDTFTTAEESIVSLSPLANDIDGDPLSIDTITQPVHGTAALSGTTQIVYTPTLDFNGNDVLTYIVSDNEFTDTASVSITVTPVNDAPVISEGATVSVTVSEDGTPVPFDLTLNAGDVESDPLTWSILTHPAHGTAGASGMAISITVDYTPTADYFGPDVFMIQVSDGGLTDTISVSVTVAPVNDAPVAVDDVAVALRQRSSGDIMIFAAGGSDMLDVLANDTDIEDDSLSIVDVGVPSQGGNLVGLGSSLVVYTPTATFTGTETFTYTITDGGLTDTATVSATVTNGVDGGVSGDTFVVVNTGADGTFTITIEIPVGVEGDGNFVLVYDELAQAAGPPPGGFAPAGAFFILKAYLDGQLLDGDHAFQQPLTLTLEYENAEVAGIGPAEASLALYYWDEGGWSDYGITVVERDVENNRLMVTIGHLTEFGFFRRGFCYLPLVTKNFVNAPDLVVEALTATSYDVQVVIANEGNSPVTDEFWVDVYVDPDTPPTAVNQTWQMLSSQGLAWGINADALPLAPGDRLTLTLGSPYYAAAWSSVNWPLTAGTPVYAQVDSVALGSDYGAVRETHEITGGAYENNIASTEVGVAASRPVLAE